MADEQRGKTDWTAVNAVISRAAAESGLTVALFSRSMFGFVGASIATLIFAATAIYFLVVFPLKIVSERRRRGEEAGPADPTDVELLTEIRDLLREQAHPRRGGRDDGGTAGRIPHQER